VSVRRLRRGVAATALILACAAVEVPGAVAQETPIPSVRLIVSTLTGTLGLPGAPEDLQARLFVDNQDPEPVGDLRIVVEVFAAVASRSEFHLAVDESQPQGRLVADRLVEVAGGSALPSGEGSHVAIEIPSDEFTDGDGVHPIRISLLHGREVLDEATTAIVHLTGPPSRPVPTVVGWPLHAPPVLDDDSRPFAPGGRLERLIWALERTPDVAAQPLIAPHVLEDLAGRVDDDPHAEGLLERLREVLADGPAPAVSVYADADLAGLSASGLALEGLQHILEARRITEEVLERRPVPDVLWDVGTLSPLATRQILVPARVQRVLLQWTRLEGAVDEPERTPPAITSLAPGGGVTAVVSDPWLARRLAGLDGDRTLLAVQNIIAETAFVHRERPYATDHALVLLPPPDWAVAPSTAVDLLSALGSAPWLTIEGLEDLAERGIAAETTSGLATPPHRTVDARLGRSIGAARTRLNTLQDALAEPTDGVGGLTWEALDRNILHAAARTEDAAANLRLVLEVEEAVAEGLGSVTLPTEAQVTLTDVEGTVPVTVSRAAGPPIHLTISLEAPPRLGFPDGATREITLAEGEQRTLTFRTTAHAVGRVPITVYATLGPDATGLTLAEGEVVVRSTAISGVALASLGGALLVVLVWWVVRSLRRPRPPQLRVVDTEREAA
jgi:hypothetical protein